MLQPVIIASMHVCCTQKTMQQLDLTNWDNKRIIRPGEPGYQAPTVLVQKVVLSAEQKAKLEKKLDERGD